MSLAVLKTRCSLLQHSSTSWNRSTSSTPHSTSGEYGYLMSCVFVYFTVLIRTISLGNWVIFFPFGTNIWGSTTSVTFDASGHLSDQWVWPSVWSASVDICLISECGHLCGHLSDQWVWPSVWSLRVASCFVLDTLRPLMNTLLPYVTKSF